jgi:hypothetical protein
VGLVQRLIRSVDKQVKIVEPATVVSFDLSTRSYTVDYKGAIIGPVWSANNVFSAVGSVVQVVVENGVVLSIVP